MYIIDDVETAYIIDDVETVDIIDDIKTVDIINIIEYQILFILASYWLTTYHVTVDKFHCLPGNLTN